MLSGHVFTFTIRARIEGERAKRTPFQFETATETFFRNVPFRPADFATLETEIPKAPAIIRGRFCFAVSILCQREFGYA
jgi:hypothetical protein